MVEQKKSYSMLSDGSVIPRAYVDDNLEAKRIDAINKIGTRWIMHPVNFVKMKSKR